MPEPDQPTNPEAVEAPIELQHEESAVEADEKAYEQTAESKEDFLETETAPELLEKITEAAPPAATPTAPPTLVKDEAMLKVEKILEEGLGELYESLSPQAKPIFKKKGEEVANEIAEMVRSFKVKASRVLKLIKDWLLTIPKVNRFFLEQEAKIKTDKVMELNEARYEDSTQKT